MILSFVSFKGGSGKSTLSQNIAVQLAHYGYKVGIIDADETQVTVEWSRLRSKTEIIGYPHIDVIGETDPKRFKATMDEFYYNSDLDVVIVDCPPSTSSLVDVIIRSGSILIIPTIPGSGSDVWANRHFLSKLEDTFNELGKRIPTYFAVNRYLPETNLHKDFLVALKTYEKDYQVKIMKTKIRQRIAFGYANTLGLGVVEYSDKKARKEIEELTKEAVKYYKKIMSKVST